MAGVARRGLSMMTAAHWLSLLLFPFLLVRSDSRDQCNPTKYNLGNVTYPSGYDKILNMSVGFHCADYRVFHFCFCLVFLGGPTLDLIGQLLVSYTAFC